MTASISINVLAIIALCFTIILAKRNIVINNYKNKLYLIASSTTIILLFVEIMTILLGLSGKPDYIIPNRIANVIGFSLCPVVPYVLMLFNLNIQKRAVFFRVLELPIYFNAIICILSYKTGWVFYVDAQNQYSRGNSFFLPAIICMIYFVVMVISIIKNRADYEAEDKATVIPIIVLPLIGVIIQILFKEFLLIWSSTSVSLLLYYIFLRELQFKYDVQTGIKNRAAFEKEMAKYLKSDNDATLVVLDINDFKRINDDYGHKIGDEVLFHAAKIIKESFLNTGRTFRIGGDEFCVILKETSSEFVENALLNFDRLLAALNKNRKIKIGIAYGYTLHIKNEKEDIYSAFSKADKAMYQHKAKLKETKNFGKV